MQLQMTGIVGQFEIEVPQSSILNLIGGVDSSAHENLLVECRSASLNTKPCLVARFLLARQLM